MNPEWLQAVSAFLEAHPGWLAATFFIIAFLESLAIAGIIVPGVALIFVVAVLAGKTGMPVSEAFLWSGLGAILGDSASFALGRLCQDHLDRVWPLSRFPGMIQKGEVFFRRHGGKSVVIGRFIGPVRPVIPLVAGALLMPWRRFLAFNISSAIGWAPTYVLPGYLVGSALASEFQPPPHFYPVLGVSLTALTVVYLLLFRVQLGLGNQGRVYQWFYRTMARYNSTHKFWRLYSSDRPAQSGEFPLASFSLALGAGGLFLIWALLATTTELLRPFDLMTSQWFVELRYPLLEPIFLLATLAGDPIVLLAGTAMAAVGLWFRGYYAAALHVFAASVLTVVAVWALKSAGGVERPELALLPPTSNAFPSGHTAGITVFFGLLASFIAREYRGKYRWQIYLIFSLPIIMTALSRMYLGIHWFSDVVGGLLLGMAITGAVRASYSRYDRIHLGLDSTTAILALGWGSYLAWHLATHLREAAVNYMPLV